MALRNPTRAEKQAYRERVQHGQGSDLDPKSSREIQSNKKSSNPFSKESDEEARLSGSKNLQYIKNTRGLSSQINYDDYSEESEP